MPIDDVCAPFTPDLAVALLPGSVQAGESSFREETGGGNCNYVVPDTNDPDSFATLVFTITDTRNPNALSLGGRDAVEELVSSYAGTFIDMPEVIPGAYCYEFVRNGATTVSFVWMRGDFSIGVGYLRTADRTPVLSCGDLAPVGASANANL